MSNTHRGSSFNDFLREEGIFEEVQELATRRIIAWQLKQRMAETGVTKTEMAERMKTSHSQVDRILEGEDPGIRLETLERSAAAVDCKLQVELIQHNRVL